MSQQPAKPVQTPLSRACAVIAVLLFVAAGFGWHTGWVQEHLRKPVLEKPIRFEEGFSLTATFSVPYEHNYWVEVVCPRAASSSSQSEEVLDSLSAQLPVKFTITCDGVTVAKGDSTKKDDGANSASEDTRIMAGFQGEPGKHYELSFHTVGANPALNATKPSLRISSLSWTGSNLLNWVFSDTKPALFVAGIGLLFAIWPCWILICKRRPDGQSVGEVRIPSPS